MAWHVQLRITLKFNINPSGFLNWGAWNICTRGSSMAAKLCLNMLNAMFLLFVNLLLFHSKRRNQNNEYNKQKPRPLNTRSPVRSFTPRLARFPLYNSPAWLKTCSDRADVVGIPWGSRAVAFRKGYAVRFSNTLKLCFFTFFLPHLP